MLTSTGNEMISEQERVEWKWPSGLGNQIALFVVGTMFAVSTYRLMAQLLFEYRLHIPEPRDYDIVNKIAFVFICIAPLFAHDFRRRHSFLLTSFILFAIASLFLRLIRFISPEQSVTVEILVSLLWSFATAIFGVGLLRGQEANKFFPEWFETSFTIALIVVMFLPLKLFGVDIIAELKKASKK